MHEVTFLYTLLEEAQRFLSGPGNLYISYLFSQVRGVGISFLAFVQTSGIADHVVANTSVKALGRANLASDYQRFGACIGINSDQVVWAKHNIRPGLFIFKLSDGKFLRPFLVQVPLLPPLPPVSDEQIVQSQDLLDHTALVPVEEPEVQDVARSVLLPAPRSTEPSLSLEELCFLKAIANYPDRPSSKFAKLLGISTKKSISLRKVLVNAGWVSEHRLDSGGRGGRSIVLELTQEGRSVLENAG